MDPPSKDSNDEDFLESHPSSHPQPSNGPQKRSWRRLFGKNNSNNNNKRQENQDSHGSSKDGNRPPSVSQSSSSDSGADSTQKRERQSKSHQSQQQHHHHPHGVSPPPNSDKRDDGTESSQNTFNQLNEILDNYDADAPSPIDLYNGNKKSSIASLTSLPTPATTTSITATSAVTQQHRNHISPIQMATANTAPASALDNTTRSTSRHTSSTRSSLLVEQVRHNRSMSSFSTATAATKKILSRPFGREHIMITVQKVCYGMAKQSSNRFDSAAIAYSHLASCNLLSGWFMLVVPNGIRTNPCGNTGSTFKNDKATSWKILPAVSHSVPYKTFIGWNNH
jgi:hypothetical protein